MNIYQSLVTWLDTHVVLGDANNDNIVFGKLWRQTFEGDR